jgi:ATP-dependent RNA helicase DeaD
MTNPKSPEPPTLPPPTFEILPLSPETQGALARMGYTHPTPVQRVVFEPATRGVDLVVQARTGTGKTAAFGLPIVESVVRRNQRTVQALVLCPTRELALQVSRELGRLGEPRGIEPIAIYGGAPMGKQTDALASGAQVVVGTPGRVLDHLRRGTMRSDDIRMLVLDEADEMLSMGFERELSAILERLPKTRQTVLFSATIPPDIERIARDRLRSPEFITLSSDHVGALEVLHFVYVVPGDKIETFLRILEVENPDSALVFCNTKADTERVAEALERQGFAADWLNGDLPQGEREQVMARTREGKLRFLVATDVAARGIDISHLSHVINFDFPETAEQYIHRTGRTGRMGRTGSAVSLIAPKDVGNLYLLRLTYKIRPIEKQLPTEGELKTRAEADLVQLLADAFLTRPAHPDDLALARRLLSHDGAEQIVAGLVRDHLGVRGDAGDVAAAARRSKMPPPSTAAIGPAADQPAPRVIDPPPRDPPPRAESPAPRARPAPKPRSHDKVEDAGIKWTEQPHGEAQNPDWAEIFVSVGRRDGVKPSDLQRLLTDVAHIPPSDAERIRVRDRNAFVSVKREMLDRALAALNGAAIAGKVVQAEPAKPRSS